jgi:hypothetical protein
MHFAPPRNNPRSNDLIQRQFITMDAKAEPVMGRITDSSETIDAKTSRSICDAVGERLQQSLRPELSSLSPRLQFLMDELRRRDSEDFRKNSN